MLATGASSQGPGPGGSRLRLAAYDGRQPASFRVSAVPAGFREYRVGPNEIDFAGPPDNRPARPLIAPAPAPATGVDPHDVLPLSVLLTPAAQRPANAWDARRVDVNGRPAVLYRLSGSAGAPGVQRLDVSVSPGRELVVWIGPLLPWAPSEVVAFADGIHIA
jgi:hypothetical protein